MIIGIVGKPNCGKSTFFKSVTLADVLIANYPFATIEPNKGFAHVTVECVDNFFNVQCNPRFGFCMDHTRFVPIEVIDVAGLVPGAHEGKGLGNKFLDDLNHAEALIHVIDASGMTNEKGEYTGKPEHDPLDDVLFLENELNYWMYDILMKVWEKFARTIVQTHQQSARSIAKQLSAFNVTEDLVKEVMRKLDLGEDITKWSKEQIFDFIGQIRFATKPIVIAANKADLPSSEENIKRLKERFPQYIIMPTAAEAELALREAANKGLIKYIPGSSDFEIKGNLSDAQRKGLEYVRNNILKKYGSTGVQKLLDTIVFDFLKYIAIFPGGVGKLMDSEGRILPDCFLLKQGSTTFDFANTIHTDLAQGFIRAIDVKTKKTLGKEHVLKHRDVIEIISSK
jgi:ribosome-binding ATPase